MEQLLFPGIFRSDRSSPIPRNFWVAFLPFPRSCAFPCHPQSFWAGDGNFIFVLSLAEGVLAAVVVQEHSLLLPALTVLQQEHLPFS